MDKIKDWAVLICTSSVLSGILTFLIPEGRLKKTANTVISLFMLSVFISLFSSVDILTLNIDTDTSIDTDIYVVEINEYLISQSNKTAQSLIEDEINEICDYPIEVDTEWSVSDNVYTLTNVIITINAADSSKISVIKTKTSSITGIIPEVNIE